jgi:hypothetical protein
MVERTGIVWRSGAGSRHFVVFSGRIRGVDLRKQLFSEDYSACQVENALTVAGNIALKHRHFSRKKSREMHDHEEINHKVLF